MKNYIQKNINWIIAIFVLMGPILDFFTGICLHYSIPLTLGIIVRVLFLISFCFIVLFIFGKKKILIPYFIIGLYFIFYFIGILLYKNKADIFFELQNLVKVFYFPILLISFYAIREEIHVSKFTLFLTLLLYLLFLFFPLIFHVGYQTYAITKAGTLGFFHSANEIGGIISLLTPILFYMISIFPKKKYSFLIIVLYFVVIFMMGTKTPLLSFCFTLGVSLAYLLVNCWKKRQYKKILFSLLLLLVGFSFLIAILPKTTFYKNIEVHLDFLGINNVSEIFSKKEYIDHFIFSQRLTFLKNKSLIYKESPFYQKLFGIGYLKNGEEMKQIEMDYFDIYYNHGIVGFLLLFTIFLAILISILRSKRTKSYERFMMDASLYLIFLLSFFTGHILTTPSVSLIAIIIILMLPNEEGKEWKRIIKK